MTFNHTLASLLAFHGHFSVPARHPYGARVVFQSPGLPNRKCHRDTAKDLSDGSLSRMSVSSIVLSRECSGIRGFSIGCAASASPSNCWQSGGPSDRPVAEHQFPDTLVAILLGITMTSQGRRHQKQKE